MIKEIKIGFLTYNVSEKKHMSSEDLGEINYDELEININKKTSNNYRIKKRKVYEVLLHEIVHGIDYAVKFTKKDKENTIDLIAFYIANNINNLQNKKFGHFKKYLRNYEIKIKREKVVFKTILNVLNENQKLTKKIKEVFKYNDMTINGYKKVKEITYDSCNGCDLLIDGLCKKVSKLGFVSDCIGVIYKKDKKSKRL